MICGFVKVTRAAKVTAVLMLGGSICWGVAFYLFVVHIVFPGLFGH